MKNLLIVLTFAMGVLAGVPARVAALAQSVSVSTSVAVSDMIAPAKVKTTNGRKTEALSAISFFAVIASIVNSIFGWLNTLSIFSHSQHSDGNYGVS